MELGAAVATILAISLAGERIVAIVKTIAPGWFSDAPAAGATPADPFADRGRRFRVQLVAFLACWAAAAALAVGGQFDMAGTVSLGGLLVPAPLVGLLSMGGSAFWSHMLGITGALKDLRTAQAKEGARPQPAAPAQPDKVQAFAVHGQA